MDYCALASASVTPDCFTGLTGQVFLWALIIGLFIGIVAYALSRK